MNTIAWVSIGIFQVPHYSSENIYLSYNGIVVISKIEWKLEFDFFYWQIKKLLLKLNSQEAVHTQSLTVSYFYTKSLITS